MSTALRVIYPPVRVFRNVDLSRFPSGLGSAGQIDGVTEQTVARHAMANDTGNGFTGMYADRYSLSGKADVHTHVSCRVIDVIDAIRNKQIEITTGLSSTITSLHRSIISRASRAMHLACCWHGSGKPLTAMYLSPTVSTCGVMKI